MPYNGNKECFALPRDFDPAEADVEAATSAWTGHTDDWETDVYEWRPEWHDASRKSFLGRSINGEGDPTAHGTETIEVVLGNGVVPSGATIRNASL